MRNCRAGGKKWGGSGGRDETGQEKLKSDGSWGEKFREVARVKRSRCLIEKTIRALCGNLVWAHRGKGQ